MTESSAAAALGGRLEELFSATRTPTGKVWTNVEMAGRLHDQGIEVTAAYISLLRRGHRTSPDRHVVAAMATAFDVPASQIWDIADASRLGHDLELVATIRSAGLAEIIVRASSLSPMGRRQLGVIVDALRRVEGGDDLEDEAGGDSVEGDEVATHS